MSNKDTANMRRRRSEKQVYLSQARENAGIHFYESPETVE